MGKNEKAVAERRRFRLRRKTADARDYRQARRTGGGILEKETMSKRQFVILTALFVIGDTILFVPAAVSREAWQDAWLSALLAMAAGLCFAGFFGILAGLFPRMTLNEMSERALGPWLGKAASLLFVGYFLIDSGIILWQVGDFMVTHIMPETPVQSFLILFMLIVVLGYRLGPGTVVRSAEILFFCVVVLFALLVLLLSPQFEAERLRPFLEEGPVSVVRGALLLIGYYMESFILLMLVPHLKNTGSLTGSYLLGMTIGSFVLTVTIFLCILVLGPDLTQMQMFTTYVLAKKINIANFLERIEVIMASLWLFTLFFKLYVCYYATVEGAARLLKLKDGKTLSLPLAVVVVGASLVLVPNIVFFDDIVLHLWWPYTATFSLALPLIMLAAAAAKRPKKKLAGKRLRPKHS